MQDPAENINNRTCLWILLAKKCCCFVCCFCYLFRFVCTRARGRLLNSIRSLPKSGSLPTAQPSSGCFGLTNRSHAAAKWQYQVAQDVNSDMLVLWADLVRAVFSSITIIIIKTHPLACLLARLPTLLPKQALLLHEITPVPPPFAHHPSPRLLYDGAPSACPCRRGHCRLGSPVLLPCAATATTFATALLLDKMPQQHPRHQHRQQHWQQR